MVVFSVVLYGAKETPELSLGGVSRSSIFYFSRSEKRAEISFKVAKIG